MSRREYIGAGLMFIGLTALLGTVWACDVEHLPDGVQAYQLYCLGYTSVVFAVCCTCFAFMVRREKRSQLFYRLTVWSLILSGCVEALWGMGQIYGLFRSNHALYMLTGSFYNPGPYSGYLAMVFPVSLDEWLRLRKTRVRTTYDTLLMYASGGVCVLLLCVLPAGMSRAAWIAAFVSGIVVCGIRCEWFVRLKRLKWKTLSYAALAGCIIMGAVGYALLNLKVASACGRLFIWKICCKAIAEAPFCGYGSNSFARVYGNTQEAYFSKGTYVAWEEHVAGSPEYAFNEYLQIALEYGIPVLLFVLCAIIFCIRCGIQMRRNAVCGGMISFLIFAFASYPLHIPGFVVTLFVVFAAGFIGDSRWWYFLWIVIALGIGLYAMRYNHYEACKQWTRCQFLYRMGDYSLAEKEYGKLYPLLQGEGVFLFEYGHCLHKQGMYAVSNRILKEAIGRTCDPMILNIIGKNYQAMGEYGQAEQWLVRSIHRLPGRIYPYYLLVKLYAEPEFYDAVALRDAAKIVLTKEPKVPSAAIKEMRREVENVVSTKIEN